MVDRCGKASSWCVCLCVQCLFTCLFLCESWFYKYKVLKTAVQQLKEGRAGKRKVRNGRGRGDGEIFQLKSGEIVKIKNPSGVTNLFFIT